MPSIPDCKQEEITRHLHRYPPKPWPKEFAERELVPTKEELETIESCEEAFSQTLIDLDLEPTAPFPTEQIHFFLPSDPVWTMQGELGGFYRDGHVGFQREARATLASKACHELGHAHAKHALSVSIKSSDEKTLLIQPRHEGQTFYPDNKKTEDGFLLSQFVGFNEGVVELLANSVRRKLVKMHGDEFTEAERRALINEVSYPFHITLVRTLVEDVHKQSGIKLKEAWRMLVNDLREGTYVFIKQLTAIHPEAGKILLAMGKSNDDAKAAATALGERYAIVNRIRAVPRKEG